MQSAPGAVESIGASLNEIVAATAEAEQSARRVRDASLAIAA